MAVVTAPVEIGLAKRVRRAGQAVRPIAVSALGAALLLALAVIGALALDTAYARRALPGVTIGGIPVGSLDEIALRERLRDAAAAWPNAAVEVPFEGRSWASSTATLGLTPDIDRAVRAAVAFGKAGPLALRVGAWASALAGRAALDLPLASVDGALARWVDEIARDIERPVTDGELRITADGVVATAPASGRYVDRVSLAAALGAAASAQDRQVVVPTREVLPATDPARFAALVEEARHAVAPVAVRAGAATLTLDTRALSGVVVARRVALDQAAAPHARDTFAPVVRSSYALAVDEVALGAAAEGAAATLDRPARSAGYALRANGTLAVTPAETGARVDRLALAAALRRAVADPQAPRSLSVATAPVAPAFDTAQAERDAPGMTRIAFFETYGAPGDGVAPLELVVAGGQRFSATGIPAAVSGALAGAALAAGLEASPGGLGWRNDTEHAILARAVPTRTSVIAELWGLPGDREVSWGPPDAAGAAVRTVRTGAGILHQEAVPGPLGPPRAAPALPEGDAAPVTAPPAPR